MWPFTGGCNYSHGCEKYEERCGACPELNSSHDTDLSRWGWVRKNRAYEDCDLTIIATSEWMKRRVKQASLTEGLRIEKIPNGVDTRIFKPINQNSARNIFNLPHNKNIVLFGAINPNSNRKGLEYLKRALGELTGSYDDSEIEIAVFGRYTENGQLPFDVNNVGYLYDDETLSLLYSAGDVMIVPSTEDVFPNTALEATSCGTPVVAFEDTGAEDIVEHKHTGYISKYKDPFDLAEGIRWVLDNYSDKNLSTKSRELAQNKFDIRLIAEEYKHLYNDILYG
jgi:glycosyltransferase involved in cell wall biosynthesis